MSAPSIPNLLSLRGSSRGGGERGRGRVRGRSRGGHGGGLDIGSGRGRGGPVVGPGSASTHTSQSHDATIQGTDTDAAVSRLSAVHLGYLQDPFASLFVQPTPPGHPSGRRLPIINRGTYTRTTAIDKLVDVFLSQTHGKERQIISLGAGTDTRSLRLFSGSSSSSSSPGALRGPAVPPVQNLTYHEIDFPDIRARKLRIVRAAPQLRSVLSDPVELSFSSASSSAEVLPPPPPQEQQQLQTGSNSLTVTPQAPDKTDSDATITIASWHSKSTQSPTSQLFFHGIDLRDLARNANTRRPLSIPHLRSDIPSLLISECCLCYLSSQEASSVISHFTTLISQDLGIILYEPIKPDDPFGQMMVSNLAARGIIMPTLEIYRRPTDQEVRLREAGFNEVRQMTVDDIWERWIHEDEKERVDSLEGLDEVEEWKLLAGHYIVAWGWKGDGFKLNC